jgi:hypothetical protein
LLPNYQTFYVRTDGSELDLKHGKYAMIDTTDTEPVHGELFVVQHRAASVGGGSCRLPRPCPDQLPGLQRVFWTGDLRGNRKAGTVDGLKLFEGLSDGPYQPEDLRGELVGRVVGYAPSPLGNQLAAARGWIDEHAGNAAFDATEYIEVLLAAGYTVRAIVDRDGREFLLELVPDHACRATSGRGDRHVGLGRAGEGLHGDRRGDGTSASAAA